MLRLFLILVLVGSCVFAEDSWSRFRGPGGSGVSGDARPPKSFGQQNLVWKIELERGASSPVLAGDRIFLTGAREETLVTYAIDRQTGRVLWERSIPASRSEKKHKLNDPASSTPATDGKNVHVFFGDYGLITYDRDGKEKWRKPLGPFTNLHGMAASPVLGGGKLYLVCDQDVGSFLLALDPETGKELWRVDRQEVVHGFSTPVYHQASGGPAELIVPGSYQVIGYDAATGKKLWWVRGVTWQVKSTPALGDGVVYFNGWAPGGDPGQQAYLPEFEQALKECDANNDKLLAPDELPKPYQPTGSWDAIDLDNDGFLDGRDWHFFRSRRAAENSCVAIKLGGRGDVTESHVLWRHNKGIPDVPSPLLYKGVVYLVKTGGIATALDAKSGEVKKQARLTGALDGYYASPVAADGRVYMMSQEGNLVVLKADPQWSILEVHSFGEEAYATPALAEDKIYIRTQQHLYCFRSN